jgi:AAA domain-containing protein
MAVDTPTPAEPVRKIGGRSIRQAVRRGKRARIALSGPAGSGKTWTALILAGELAPQGRVLVLDTEHASSELYADDFAFEVLPWYKPYDPRQLAETIEQASTEYDVVIVDSLSHFWTGTGGTLDLVESTATRSAGGNRFAGWKTGSPAQESMVESMLAAKCHVIACMRSKTEFVQEKNERTGRTEVRKIGLAPVQRDGIEYEFTVTCDIDFDHRISISKTRCHLLSDRLFAAGRAGEMGRILHDWLDSGAEEVTPELDAPPATEPPRVPPGTPPVTAPPAIANPHWQDIIDMLAVLTDEEERVRVEVALGKANLLRGAKKSDYWSLPSEKAQALLTELQALGRARASRLAAPKAADPPPPPAPAAAVAADPPPSTAPSAAQPTVREIAETAAAVQGVPPPQPAADPEVVTADELPW